MPPYPPEDGKFAVPVAAHLVSRPRLHARLTAGLEFSCTLIAASAGWGKPGRGLDLARPCRGRSAGPVDGNRDGDCTGHGERAAADLRHVRGRRGCGDCAGEGCRDPRGRRHAGRPGSGQSPRDRLTRRAREPATAGAAPTARARVLATTHRDPPWPLHRLRLAGEITAAYGVPRAR